MHRVAIPLNIFFFILILLISARMFADVASYKLGTLSSGSGASSALQQPEFQQKRAIPFQSHGIILEKGLFGPATRGTLTQIARKSASDTPSTSQSDLILLGTAAGSSGTSFILVRKNSSNEERVFKTNEKVFDLGILTTVQKETAEIRSGNQTITLRTPSAPAEAGKSAVGQQPAVTPATVSGNSRIIDQRALNAALDNIGQAMTDARLLPSLKDGKVEGFRITEIKPLGLFASVGLKNGDVLLKINDFPIDSPEKSIQSFMTLKGQNRIKLDLIRDGSPSTMTYDIR